MSGQPELCHSNKSYYWKEFPDLRSLPRMPNISLRYYPLARYLDQPNPIYVPPANKDISESHPNTPSVPRHYSPSHEHTHTRSKAYPAGTTHD